MRTSSCHPPTNQLNPFHHPQSTERSNEQIAGTVDISSLGGSLQEIPPPPSERQSLLLQPSSQTSAIQTSILNLSRQAIPESQEYQYLEEVMHTLSNYILNTQLEIAHKLLN